MLFMLSKINCPLLIFTYTLLYPIEHIGSKYITLLFESFYKLLL